MPFGKNVNNSFIGQRGWVPAGTVNLVPEVELQNQNGSAVAVTFHCDGNHPTSRWRRWEPPNLDTGSFRWD